MKDYILLEEAAKIPGMPTAPSLRARIGRGELQGIKVPKGSRLVWALSIHTVQQLQKQVDSPTSEYETCITRWQEEQRSGYRRKFALKEVTIDRNNFGMTTFWDFLDGVRPCCPKELKERRQAIGQAKTLSRFTLENISLAIAKIPRENPSTKEGIYKATMSFYQSLIWQGLRPEYDLIQFKHFKPRQNRRPRRTFVKSDEIYEQLLLENKIWYNGRSKYDILLSDILLRFLYCTGLRNSEACTISLRDVNFKQRTISFIGKGDKEREIGISPELFDPLKAYLEKRPKSREKFFFLQEDGTPLNRRVVSNRVKKVAARLGEDLTPHGLRRTFITNLLKDGTPSVLVQKIAGHERISTTELYNMTSSRDALDVLRKRGRSTSPVSEPEPAVQRLEFEF